MYYQIAKTVGETGGRVIDSTLQKDEYGNVIDTSGNRFKNFLSASTSPIAALKNSFKYKDYMTKQERAKTMFGYFTGMGGLVGSSLTAAQGRYAQEFADKQALENIKANTFNNSPGSTIYKYGGSITEYKGNKHELGGINIGNDKVVEGGETKGIGRTKDYIFSNSIMYDDVSSFADKSKEIDKKYSSRPNDKISIASKEDELNKLKFMQDGIKLAFTNNPEKFINKGIFRSKYSIDGKLRIPNYTKETAVDNPNYGKAFGKQFYELGGSFGDPPVGDIQTVDQLDNSGILNNLSTDIYNTQNTNGLNINTQGVSTDLNTGVYGINQNQSNVKGALWTKNSTYNLQGNVKDLNGKIITDASYFINPKTGKPYWQDASYLEELKTKINNDPNFYKNFKNWYESNPEPNYNKTYDPTKEAIINKLDESISRARNGSIETEYNTTGYRTIPRLALFDKIGGFNSNKVNIGNSTNNITENSTDNSLIDNNADIGKTLDNGNDNGNSTDIGTNTQNPTGGIKYGDKYIPSKPDNNRSILPYVGGLTNVALGLIGLNDKAKYPRVTTQYVYGKHYDPQASVNRVRGAYAGANESIRQSTNNIGSYLANRLASASAEAGATSGIYSKYDAANTGIDNQIAEYNSKLGFQGITTNANIDIAEQNANEAMLDAARNMIGTGASQLASTALLRERERRLAKAQEMQLMMAGGENYGYRIIGGDIVQTRRFPDGTEYFVGTDGKKYGYDPKKGKYREILSFQ